MTGSIVEEIDSPTIESSIRALIRVGCYGNGHLKLISLGCGFTAPGNLVSEPISEMDIPQLHY